MPDWPVFNDSDILAARGLRNGTDVMRPWAFLVEPERSASGRVEDVATLFLTNRECPIRCLMCDLWQNTTTEPVSTGAIPAQIDFALSQLPPARHIKLYNSANFFDPMSIPVADYPAIVERVRGFDSVIVENHPKLTGPRCLKFRDLLAEHDVELEVALGLETIHPDVLPRLNKQMTVEDFDRAARLLTEEGIRVRAFVLLRPPFLSDREGIEWAVKSVEHAFRVGVSVCSIVPTRAGNGMMEQLQREGHFSPPSLAAMEETLARCLELTMPESHRVFVDLWDAVKFATCLECSSVRIDRLRRINLSQTHESLISTPCCGPELRR